MTGSLVIVERAVVIDVATHAGDPRLKRRTVGRDREALKVFAVRARRVGGQRRHRVLNSSIVVGGASKPSVAQQRLVVGDNLRRRLVRERQHLAIDRIRVEPAPD